MLRALLLSLVALLSTSAFSQFKNEAFTKIIYLKHGGTGTGAHAGSPLPIDDGDLWAIPAGTLIKNVYVIIDAAVTGTTDIDIGDDDNGDGYVDGTLALAAGLGTPAMYNYAAKLTGDYLKVQTAGATDAADIDIVPNAKYYAAAGKELKIDVTTASTAGVLKVVVEGFYFK